MLTDPVKFHEYFQIAHTQLQGSKKESSKSAPGAKTESSTKPELPSKKQITEFDDVTLFLLTLPHHLLEGKEEKVKN